MNFPKKGYGFPKNTAKFPKTRLFSQKRGYFSQKQNFTSYLGKEAPKPLILSHFNFPKNKDLNISCQGAMPCINKRQYFVFLPFFQNHIKYSFYQFLKPLCCALFSMFKIQKMTLKILLSKVIFFALL